MPSIESVWNEKGNAIDAPLILEDDGNSNPSIPNTIGGTGKPIDLGAIDPPAVGFAAEVGVLGRTTDGQLWYKEDTSNTAWKAVLLADIGTAAEIDNVVQENDKLAIVTDSKEIRLGDGVTSGGQTISTSGELFGFKYEEVLVTTPLPIIQVTVDDHRKVFDVKRNDFLGFSPQFRLPSNPPIGFTVGVRYSFGPLYTPAGGDASVDRMLFQTESGSFINFKGYVTIHLPASNEIKYYRHLGDNRWEDIFMTGAYVNRSAQAQAFASFQGFFTRNALTRGFNPYVTATTLSTRGGLGDAGRLNYLYRLEGLQGIFYDPNFMTNDILLAWTSEISYQLSESNGAMAYRIDEVAIRSDRYDIFIPNAVVHPPNYYGGAGKFEMRKSIIKTATYNTFNDGQQTPFIVPDNWTAFTWMGSYEIGAGGLTSTTIVEPTIGGTPFHLYVDGSDNLIFDLKLEDSIQTISTTISTGDNYADSNLIFVIRCEQDSIRISYSKDNTITDYGFVFIDLDDMTTVAENTTTWTGSIPTGDFYLGWENSVEVNPQADLIAKRVLTDDEVNALLYLLPRN